MLIYLYHPALHAPERAAAEARRVEALGYDGLAMPDHLFVPDFTTGAPSRYAHATTVLAACAAVTSRIRLVTLVANNLARQPVELAHAAATLARVAGPGRLDLGVGAGWFRPEFDSAGVAFPAPRERRERLVEAVGIWRALFRDGSVDLDGRYYRVHVPPGGFLPVEGGIPIMVGAAAPRMIEAAAAVADRVDFQPDSLAAGTVDFTRYDSYDAAQLRAGVARARAAGGPALPVSESPFVQVAKDAARARRLRAERAGRLGLPEVALERGLGTIIGTAEEVVERLAAFAEAGCDRVHLQGLDEHVPERLATHLPVLHAMPPGPPDDPSEGVA